ncbi:MAG: hypothetical protein ACE14L_09540 [Terriglobales bacterium]
MPLGASCDKQEALFCAALIRQFAASVTDATPTKPSKARSCVAEGKRWVVDLDLEKFFDLVNTSSDGAGGAQGEGQVRDETHLLSK